MKVLAMDTTGNVSTVAILEDEKLICEFTLNHKKTHSQTLMPTIHNLCEASETPIQEIDLIAVSKGPGSFTGIRIGVSTARALAQALNKPIVGIVSLDAMALNVGYTEYLICPIMDAKRSQVYTCIYEYKENELVNIIEHKAIPLDELLTDLKKYNKKVIFLGDGVFVYKDYIENNFEKDKVLFVEKNNQLQRASSVGCIAFKYEQKGQLQQYNDINPFYIRNAQADEQKCVGV